MTFDPVPPMVAVADALLPYAVLAIPVSVGTQHGLTVLGRVLERRRPLSHAIVGLALTTWCLTAGWAGFIGFEVGSARLMGQASVDGTLQGVADSESLVLDLSQMSAWSLTGISSGIFAAVLVLLPKPVRTASSRRRSYVED